MWEKILAFSSCKADLGNVCIDSTVVRAHAFAAGAAASNAAAEALGRSRGGFGYKIHALTDALGLPVSGCEKARKYGFQGAHLASQGFVFKGYGVGGVTGSIAGQHVGDQNGTSFSSMSLCVNGVVLTRSSRRNLWICTP